MVGDASSADPTGLQARPSFFVFLKPVKSVVFMWSRWIWCNWGQLYYFPLALVCWKWHWIYNIHRYFQKKPWWQVSLRFEDFWGIPFYPSFLTEDTICCSASFFFVGTGERRAHCTPIQRMQGAPAENCLGDRFQHVIPAIIQGKFGKSSWLKNTFKKTLGWEGICDSSFPEGYVPPLLFNMDHVSPQHSWKFQGSNFHHFVRWTFGPWRVGRRTWCAGRQKKRHVCWVLK